MITIEYVYRFIGITAMVLLLVVAAPADQTTSTPLYVDGVQRVVATFHRIDEGSSRSVGFDDQGRDRSDQQKPTTHEQKKSGPSLWEEYA
jgi:hypothetical protein